MTNALTTTNNDTLALPSQNEWSLMRDMAAQLVPTGFLPASIKTPEQALAIMLKGRELRIPPMQAMSNITMVQGKPTVATELMLALIYRDHGHQALRVKETDNEHCTIEYRTAGWDGTSEYTFTIEDAKRAGLVKGGPWIQYPAVMLRWRAISQVAKFAFPDSIGGMYAPGELGDEVEVTASGDLVSAAPAPRFSATVVTERAEPTNVTQIAAQNPDPDKAMKRLHAVAAKRGITHEMLHAKFAELGHDSLTTVPVTNLSNLADRIESQDDRFLEAEWKAFGWRAPQVDQETGEIIDVQPGNGQRFRTAKANLWQMVNGVWDWQVDDLDAVAKHTIGAPLSSMTADHFEELYQRLVVLDETQRNELLTESRAAIGL